MELEERLHKGMRTNAPSSIAIDITSECNFRCLHCFNESGDVKIDTLSDDEFINVIEQIAKMKPISVCICGGEPLMKYDRLIKALKILVPSVGLINMVSNAWFATKEKLQELKDIGLRGFQVSLDGKNAFQHDNFRGTKGSFDRVINTIKEAVSVGLQVIVATTPNKLNHEYISEIIDMCYDLGVSSSRMMPLIPMGRASENKILRLTPDDYVSFQLKILRAKYKYTNKMIVEWGDPLDHLFRMPANADADLNTFHMDIKSNGDVVVSPYLPIVVANVRNKSPQEIWNSGFNKIWKSSQLRKILSSITDLDSIAEFYENMGNNEKIYMEMK